MIKKWNNFIKESISEKELSELKDKSENFIGEKEMNILIKSESLDKIVGYLLKYADWRYDDIAKEIANWYKDIFGVVEGWVGSTWDRKIINESYADKSLFISNSVDFYNKIKNEFDQSGYPEISKMSNGIETTCVSTLDKIDFFEVYENHENVVVRCGLERKENINAYLLDEMADEIIPMCRRIEDEFNVKNYSMEFDDDENYLTIILGFI
jgi:hypothetical protein